MGSQQIITVTHNIDKEISDVGHVQVDGGLVETSGRRAASVGSLAAPGRGEGACGSVQGREAQSQGGLRRFTNYIKLSLARAGETWDPRRQPCEADPGLLARPRTCTVETTPSPGTPWLPPFTAEVEETQTRKAPEGGTQVGAQPSSAGSRRGPERPLHPGHRPLLWRGSPLTQGRPSPSGSTLFPYASRPHCLGTCGAQSAVRSLGLPPIAAFRIWRAARRRCPVRSARAHGDSAALQRPRPGARSPLPAARRALARAFPGAGTGHARRAAGGGRERAAAPDSSGSDEAGAVLAAEIASLRLGAEGGCAVRQAAGRRAGGVGFFLPADSHLAWADGASGNTRGFEDTLS
nr:translation initiation factor IF-2 [Oryctolagus cuniculus]